MSSNADALRAILADLRVMDARIESQHDKHVLVPRDRPRLQRLLTEAKVLVQEELGITNDFSHYLSLTISRARGPDAVPAHVHEGVEFIEGAINQINRRQLRDANAGEKEVPASNRYVSIADNQRTELTNELEALRDEARGSNDVEEEDRLIALSEIAAFEATIAQPRVSTDLIQRFVDAVLAWIQRSFTTATVQELAQRLIQALLKLIV